MEQKILKVINCLTAHTLINLYATENVVFGHIKPNDDIPINRYLEDLGLQDSAPYIKISYLNGYMIENGRIKEKDFDELCFKLYCDKIDCIFDEVPIDKSFEYNDNDIFHYKFGLYDYLRSIYNLFKDIIKTEITPDLFNSVPDILDEQEKRTYYVKISKFVLAIKLNHLRQGGRIDRYVKDLPFISPIVMRLIKKIKGHYYLKNNDINSLDYILALFSCLRFFNEYNAKLFELKILKWEELNHNIR